jgi:hypothetical protein
MQFDTPSIISSSDSGTIIATGSVSMSGSTGTGVAFSGSGSLKIHSSTSVGSSLFFPLNWLTITASWAWWDGIIQAPETTSYTPWFLLSGYVFSGSVYQIWNANRELFFSGQLATVIVRLSSSFSGQTIQAYRLINQGSTYTQFSTCIVSVVGDCIFTTNQLSLFAFAVPADTTPDTFGFTGVTNAELSTQYTSNTITLSGTNTSTTITIIGGEYSLNSGSFTTVAGSVSAGDTIVLRAFSSVWNSILTSTILTIGWVSASYSITTKVLTAWSGWGGGGWGGGGWMYIDSCPGWDFSASYYDGRCTATGTGITIIVPVFSGTFDIPPISITQPTGVKFRDISNNWAKAYIVRLVIRGIVDNVSLYHPNTNLTRAEFLKIVIRATGWTIPSPAISLPFHDVETNIWYAQYVSLALSKWMIRENVRFRPNDPITRAEATKIIMVALWVTIPAASTMTFIDVSRNNTLAKYIESATFHNIVSGQLNRVWLRVFRPNDPITRAEIAKVVVNAFGL